MKNYDVVIAGGGFSGSIAAIAASREGAKTLVIESNGFLGGTLTGAGVGPMMTFHAGDKQVIRGITDELIERLKESGKSPGHILDSSMYTYSVTPFDAEAMKYEIETMLLESGGEVLYHTMLAGAQMSNGSIESIKICNKAGVSDIKAKIFIDATGDGDLGAFAGIPFTKGREKDGAAQPMTLNMKIRDVNMEKLKEFIKKDPENFARIHKDVTTIDKVPRLSVIGFVKEFNEAKEKGEISIKREDVLFFETNNPGEIIVNTTRILGCDSTDPWSLSKAEIEGRKQCKELEAFFKKYLTGFENATFIQSGPSIGVRGSRQIKGLYTLTAEDLLNKEKFEDTIAHSGYPIDIHSPDGEGTASKMLEWGDYYNIPLRILVPENIDNLIVVGRCVSATFEAQAAIRVTPTVGAIGQAGGTAAAIAAKKMISVQNVDAKEVQERLVENGSYLDV
ncbi:MULTISPECIES: FAD-dependent oxidoreductase [Clostridium]|jgi:Dehydrogenases (flavoproteins)|uniref:FAD-dependent oxidoreductase n=3 Tax=Clostridium TaxID=1485 RepID=A0AAV3W750_9CLOT|nr:MULTISPECIES: FAD-dependent oxidoreductase [Clostridium]AMQ96019.1 glucose-inhibited division protein A [Clostridium sp. MF28]ABR35646.1 conserved hypothetical protein [Clostridium beijerinckii NCIMB 8052]AIU01521.1 hypothetical protein Cbs_3523 [Clostridium beijerinckii ATCC 35702]MBF7809715.1 FAD-dependent oxidoreductase [Clostridium beijerinckii]NOW90275.1 ribulose 1,5-bisphosphate synthetase/thiazole synthase [Clostridium beijerinckii]